jgi:hypothetical protein
VHDFSLYRLWHTPRILMQESFCERMLMRKGRIPAAAGISGLLLSVLFVAGCGKGSSGGGARSAEAKHLQHAAGLVGQYQVATQKQLVKIDQVRDWAVKQGKGSEDDFLSTRDMEPYAIAFTTRGLVVHEQTGQNGKCYILSTGSVSEIPLEDARHLVEQMKFGPGGKPQRKKG